MRCKACDSPITPTWDSKRRKWEDLCTVCIHASGVNDPNFHKPIHRHGMVEELGEVELLIENEDTESLDNILHVEKGHNDNPDEETY